MFILYNIVYYDDKLVHTYYYCLKIVVLEAECVSVAGKGVYGTKGCENALSIEELLKVLISL